MYRTSGISIEGVKHKWQKKQKPLKRQLGCSSLLVKVSRAAIGHGYEPFGMLFEHRVSLTSNRFFRALRVFSIRKVND